VARLLDARQRHHLKWLAEVRRSRHHGKYRQGARHRSRIAAWPEHHRPNERRHRVPSACPPARISPTTFISTRSKWEPNTIRFYVDTALYATFNSSQWPAGGTWVFDHPFFIILNVAVGGDWPGSPDGTTVFPQQNARRLRPRLQQAIASVTSLLRMRAFSSLFFCVLGVSAFKLFCGNS